MDTYNTLAHDICKALQSQCVLIAIETNNPVLVPIKLTSDEDLTAQIKHWTKQQPLYKRLYRRFKR